MRAAAVYVSGGGGWDGDGGGFAAGGEGVCARWMRGGERFSGYNPDRTDANLGPLKLANFKGYFVVEFREGFAGSTYGGGWGDGGLGEVWTTRVVEARVGTSFLSVEQARANLRKEIPGWDFDAVRRETAAKWNAKLGEVSVEGASADQRAEVYTALYHALLYPREFSEGGKYYSAFDDAVHVGIVVHGVFDVGHVSRGV
jgi:hypothetical protein